MIGRWRRVTVCAVVLLALGGCTEGPPPLKARQPTGPPSDSLLVIGPDTKWPEHVDVPNPAFEDDPGLAPYDAGATLATPALEGLAVYPVWTPEGRPEIDPATGEESDPTVGITFIDAHGKTASSKVYQSFDVCTGPDGKANAVLAHEGVTATGPVSEDAQINTDVLEPVTGAVVWSNSSSLWCLTGSNYAVMFEYEGFDPTGRGGVVSLKDRKVVIDLVEGWSFAAIDSHTLDVSTPDGVAARDLDTGEEWVHGGLAPRLPKWQRLAETYPREASIPSAVSDAGSYYFKLGSDWVSDPLEGTPAWYDEDVAVLWGDTPDDVRLVGRDGRVLAQEFSQIIPIGADLLLACTNGGGDDCKRTGVIKTDGTWLVPIPEDSSVEQFVGYAEGSDGAASRLSVFGPDGLISLVDVASGASMQLPNAGKVQYMGGSSAQCAGFAPQAEGGAGLPTSEAPGGFVRPDAKLVALPDGYTVAPARDDPLLLDRACETVTATNIMPSAYADDYPPELTFTADGKMLAPGVRVKHTFGPGLTFVTWGDYFGYLTTDGHWLWRGDVPAGE